MTHPVTFAVVQAEIRRLKADMQPIIRIELGMSDWHSLRQSVPSVSDAEARTSRIYGVPFTVLPIEQHFRIVREGDDGTV